MFAQTLRCLSRILSTVLLVQTGFMFPALAADGDFECRIFIGQDKRSIEDYIRGAGLPPDGFMLYTSIQDLEGFGGPADRGAGEQDFDYFASKYPAADLQVGLYMVDALEGVARGQYDLNLDKLASWLKGIPNRVYLRIGYEFDGPHNHYDPRQYAAAYRYIVDFLRSRGVQNTFYVWHSYGAYVKGDRMDWYPGEGYVDWVGVSYFEPANLIQMENAANMAKDLNRPLMIAEATPRGHVLSRDSAAWNAWFVKMFKFAAKKNARIISYINTDWERARIFAGQGWGDSRIETSPEVLAKWKEQVTAWRD